MKYTIPLKEYLRNQMSIREWVNLYEAGGYTFNAFLKSILAILKIDKFENLRAENKKDIALGLLTKEQIEELRDILHEGFVKNQSIGTIEKNIKTRMSLQDRMIEEDGALILAISAEERPRIIARTETVRLANEGAIKNFKDNGVERVRFLAVNDSRTDEACLALDGQIFDINKSRGIIPVHASCRCTWVPVIEDLF